MKRYATAIIFVLHLLIFGVGYAMIYAVLTAFFLSRHSDSFPLMLIVCAAYVGTAPLIYLKVFTGQISYLPDELLPEKKHPAHLPSYLERAYGYVQRLREDEIHDEQITRELLQAGWSEADIETVLREPVSVIPPPPPPPSHRRQEASQPTVSSWQVLEQVGVFVSLAVFVTALILTLHWFIEQWFPSDSLMVLSQIDTYAETIRRAQLERHLWILAVSYPIFAWLFLRTHQRLQHTKDATLQAVQKTFIYCTLLCSALAIGWNMVSFISLFLKTMLTMQAVLKSVTAMSICSFIFFYYLWQVSEDWRDHA